MAKIFITGSADGLGQLAAKELIKKGHRVVLHARNEERGKQALQQVPGAENVLIADLASMHETKELASKANALGTFDAVIHNAGVYQVPRNSITVDGLPLLLAVNTLAPYILTCLMHPPRRLIYMSSGMHLSGDPSLDNISPRGHVTYSDTKLHDVILAMAIGRKWPDTYANAVNPGWVPTKMGGTSAPDNLEEGYQTQVWLAVSNDAEACVSGHYFHHKQQTRFQRAAKDVAVQEKFLAMCKLVSWVGFGGSGV
ncbi:SDR family NAD(P)-dependent oxidoreductase [Mucilaginibacter ginsenosidivorans]|uniref:SDR family NAD(P)-dependent oxidoreductase n=1 Tax=Mucilaginibacter ginsenosidivorans TaxID=398053 RepID=A0A5B8UZ76_9SPHI|nr:SDR family NAD(P)-dependent oxidoreductase [Mucilaginibacter ginsenosidivorans]QEC64322.1 SDR family NAD(P)-dependent oxidoreductase [Mucilaginibacter ginsenosidivorans]